MTQDFNRPRKRFGQHFLHDPHVIQRIIHAIHPRPEEQLVEIGPGRGALTLPLLAQLQQLDIVEIDRDLVQWWQTQAHDNLKIHAGDALKLNFCELQREPSRKLRIIGNLPYNISTPILFHLFDEVDCIADMHFMLQKEVVDRMCANAGDSAYGRLSVMVQFHCSVTKLFDVSAGAFTPPPKVESSIVRLIPHRPSTYSVAPSLLQKLVAQAFSQRRKTLRNSLKSWFSPERLAQLGIDPGVRPEQLDLATFIKLAQQLER